MTIIEPYQSGEVYQFVGDKCGRFDYYIIPYGVDSNDMIRSWCFDPDKGDVWVWDDMKPIPGPILSPFEFNRQYKIVDRLTKLIRFGWDT